MGESDVSIVLLNSVLYRSSSLSDVHLAAFTAECITIHNYSPKWRWLLVDIYQAVKWRGRYPPIATDTVVNSCFSIYLNSGII